MYKIKKWIAIMLCFLLICNSTHYEAFVFAANKVEYLNKNEDIGYRMNIQYNTEKTEAVIQGDMSGVEEGITIEKILDPENNPLTIENPQYIVTENGTYTFRLQYSKNIDSMDKPSDIASGSSIDATENTTQCLEQEITVEVDQIGSNSYKPVSLSELLAEGRSIDKALQAKAYEQETYTYLGDVTLNMGEVEDNIPEPSEYSFLKDKYKKEGAKFYLVQNQQESKIEIGYITYIEFDDDSSQNGYYYTIKDEQNDAIYSQIAFKLSEEEDSLEIQYALKDRSHLKTLSVDWASFQDDIELSVNGKLLENEGDMKTVQISQGSEVMIQLQYPNKYETLEVVYINVGETKEYPTINIAEDEIDEKTHIIRKRGFTMPSNDVMIRFHIQEQRRNIHRFALFDSTSDNGIQVLGYKGGEIQLRTESGADGDWKPTYINQTWAGIDGLAEGSQQIGESFNVTSHYYNYNSTSGLDTHEASKNQWNSHNMKNDAALVGSQIKKGSGTRWAAIGSYTGSSNLTFSYQAGFYFKSDAYTSAKLLYGVADYLQYSYWNNSSMLSQDGTDKEQDSSSYTDYIPLYVNGEKEGDIRTYTTSDGATIRIKKEADLHTEYNISDPASREPVTLYRYQIEVIGATNDFSLETVSKNLTHATATIDYDTTYIKDTSIGMYKRSSQYSKHYVDMSSEEKESFLTASKAKDKPTFREGTGGATNNDQVEKEGWYQISRGFTYYNKWFLDNENVNKADPWLRIVVEEGYSPPAPRVYWSGGGNNGTFFPTKNTNELYLYFEFEVADTFEENGKNYVAYYYRMYSKGWPKDDDKNVMVKFESKPMEFTGEFYDTKGKEIEELQSQKHVLEGNLLTQGEKADPVGILPMFIPQMYEGEYFTGWNFYLYKNEQDAILDQDNTKAIGSLGVEQEKIYAPGDKIYYQDLYNQVKDIVQANGYQQLYIKAVPHVNTDGKNKYIDGIINIYIQNNKETTVDATTKPISSTGYQKKGQDTYKAIIGQKPRIAITKPKLVENGITYIANQYYVRNAPVVEKNSDGDPEIAAVFYDQKVQVEYQIEGSTSSYIDTNTYTMGRYNNSTIKIKSYTEIADSLKVTKLPEGKRFAGWKIRIGDITISDRENDYFEVGTTYNFASALQEAVFKDSNNLFYNSVFETQKIIFEAQYQLDDDPPVLTVPEVLVFNVGDIFEAKDPNIVNGLAVTDKEDKDISLADVMVEENIPKKEKDNVLFSTNRMYELTTAGTYEVQYSVTDSGGNTVRKRMKVKVNGLPYFTSQDGNTIYGDVPAEYLRTRQTENIDYYKNLKAYYEKASDTIGAVTSKTELKNSLNGANQEDGGLFIEDFANIRDPDTKVDNINNAGQYVVYYRAITPTDGEAKIARDVYVRSEPEVSANNIVISKNETTKFENWEEFLKKYEDQIQMEAKVYTPAEDGSVTEEPLDIKILTPIESIPFGKLEDQTTYQVEFEAIDAKEHYPKSEKHNYFTITVQDVIGLPPKIDLPKQYDNERVVGDKVMVNNEEREENFLQALLDEAKIYDVDNADDKATHYYGKPSESGEVGKRYGIKEKGIVSIYRVDNDKNEEIYSSIKNATLTQTELDNTIRTMYDTVGEYKVTYYAIDGDDNRIEAQRNIKVASKTTFVEAVGTQPGKNDIPIHTVNVRVSFAEQPATGVIAYHIDPDGKVHAQNAIAHTKINMKKVGKQSIIFSNTHHYSILPGTNGQKRPADIIERMYLIHGNIEFHGLDNDIYFLDQDVDLMEGVTATFKKANEDGTISDINAKVEVAEKVAYKTSIIAKEAKKIPVGYIATDEITGVELGKVATGMRTLTFIGLPRIEAKESIEIKRQASESEIKGEVNANAWINLVDSIKDLTQDIKYDFSNIQDGILKLRVTYAISSEQTRTAEKEVMVHFLDAPQITGKERLEMNVQDPFDVYTTPNIDLILGDDADVTIDDIKVSTELPITDGILTTEGTYDIFYTLTDGYGNTISKTVKVLVHSLPTIKQQELHGRLHGELDLMKHISANYVQAQEDGSLVVTGAALRVVNITDQEGNSIKQEEVNQKVGRYVVTYEAENRSGGRSTAEGFVYIHGLIDTKVVPLKINKTSVNEAEQYNVARIVSLGAIQANVLHTKSDGKIETVQLGNESMNILETNLDTSKVGTYVMKMRIRDEMEPAIERDVEIPMKVVTEGQSDMEQSNDSDSVYPPSNDSNEEGTEEEIPKEVPNEEVDDKETQDTVTEDKQDMSQDKKQQKEDVVIPYNPNIVTKTEGSQRVPVQDGTQIPIKRIKSAVVETGDRIHRKLLWTMLIGSVVAMLFFLLRKYRKRK